MRLILVLLMLSTTSAFAMSPKIEPGPVIPITQGHHLVRALIQNPEISVWMKQSYLSEIASMSGQAIQPGVTLYIINATSCGNCLPVVGQVRILEDVTPTYVDGPIEYKIDYFVEKRPF